MASANWTVSVITKKIENVKHEYNLTTTISLNFFY